MMESNMENREAVLKKKKMNIFQRLSQRVSKYFHKSKAQSILVNEGCNFSKPCLDEMPVTSKSQDDLNMKTNFKSTNKELGIPKRNDRCLSEGDLTQEDCKFYSQESSPKDRALQEYESVTGNSPKTADNSGVVLNHINGHQLKNELALKLRAKNGSEHSRTPDSPTGIETGTSPSRQLFGEARTPRSMSSLSHSSNSLLSNNHANNYATSDGESMTRSVIDSNDDIGIVVDLATPICKTTTACLLDSTAARQKISASKARRVRPKASTSVNSEVSYIDSAKFSPVRDKRDILEEISEEDCPMLPQLAVLSEEPSIDAPSIPQSTSPSSKCLPDIILEDVPLKIERNPTLSVSASDHIPTCHNGSSEDSSSCVVKVIEAGDISLETMDTSLSTIKPIESKSIVEIKDSAKHDTDGDKEPTPLPSPTDEIKRGFHGNRSRFEPHNDKPTEDSPNSSPKYYVKLRPTGKINLANSIFESGAQKAEKDVPVNSSEKVSVSGEEVPVPSSVKTVRYTPLRPFKNTTTSDNAPSITAHEIPRLEPPVTVNLGDKRSSKVLSMLKNFESAPYADSH